MTLTKTKGEFKKSARIVSDYENDLIFEQPRDGNILSHSSCCIQCFLVLRCSLIMAKKKREKRVVGWKEHAALPDLNVKNVIAKIDTGANLASIDAADIKVVTRDKVKYVKFKVMKRNNTVRKTSAPLEGYKRIKSSNGDVEKRPSWQL